MSGWVISQAVSKFSLKHMYGSDYISSVEPLEVSNYVIEFFL